MTEPEGDEKLSAPWPPVGWKQMESITRLAGHAVTKDIGKARVVGLQYEISTVPLLKSDQKIFRYDIEIVGWEYSILNESIEYPVLFLSVFDRFDLEIQKDEFVAAIQTYNTLIPRTELSVCRSISAALFFMSEINAGRVPNAERSLHFYKIHPSQAFLYRKGKLFENILIQAFSKQTDSGSF